MSMCVCVSQLRHYTCRARRVTTKTPTIHTKSIRNQIPIFNYQIYNKNTQSKRYITRYVTHIEKETKPIPLLEDWWRGIENMENMRICVWTLWLRRTMNNHRYFSWLGHWLASELRKNICVGSRLGHATRPTLDWVAKTGQHCFWKFWHFCKNKRLSKNN